MMKLNELWIAALGLAVALPAPDTVKGTPPLDPLRAHAVYWFGWVSFFPEAKIWEGGDQAR